MKPIFSAIIVMSFAASAAAAEFHVAPDGSDSNPGTAEKPFATLEKARDGIRGRRAEPGVKKAEKFDVVIHGGTYVLAKPFVLEPQDSGIVFRAASGETPVFTSAKEITGWKLADPATPGLAECAKGKVFVADIQKGWRFHFLYVDGQPATRSRSVNHENWRQWGRAFSFGPATPQGQPVTFQNREMLRNLPSNGDVEMCAIIYQFGVMGGGVMTDFDPEKGTAVWHSKQLNLHGARGGSETSFRLENALAFTDEPGEWAVDSAEGKAYYFLKDGEDMEKVKVIAPTLNRLVSLQGDDAKKEYVRDVVFEGITFSCTDRLPEDQWPDSWTVRQWENPDAAIFMEGVEDCAVRNCRIYRSGSYGVTLYRHALRCEVSGCEIGWTGSGGVQLFGFGAGFRDENRENIIRRNYIHDQGCSIYWHSPNIQVSGSGSNWIDHNFLALSAYNNISITGVPWADLNNWKAVQGGRHTMITDNTSTFAVDFSTYPPDVLEQVKAGKEYFTHENFRKLAIHSRDNKVFRNIALECNARLEEGGALYSWCPGEGNQYVENIVYKSRAMPGSSIIALDDRSEHFTVTGNVIWCEGRAGCGTIGVRPQEQGNVIRDNVRTGFKPEYADGNTNMNGVSAGFYRTETDLKSFDALYGAIKSEVDKAGGWPGSPDLNEWIKKVKSNEKFELSPDEIKRMNKVM